MQCSSFKQFDLKLLTSRSSALKDSSHESAGVRALRLRFQVSLCLRSPAIGFHCSHQTLSHRAVIIAWHCLVRSFLQRTA